MQENKQSYFGIDIQIPDSLGIYKENVIKQIDLDVDLVLDRMDSNYEIARFESNTKLRIVYFFITNKRKRLGQLSKLCKNFLNVNLQVTPSSFKKSIYKENIEDFTKNKNYTSLLPEIKESYKGKDIKIFDKRKNWHTWQRKIYCHLFLDMYSTKFKIADTRKLVFIYDPVGNSGKSTFFKWLLYQFPNEIGRVTYGNTGQLRSTILNIGPKKLYIIDLPRAKGRNDSSTELLSICEDIKNGLVTSTFQGKGLTLMMEPPHVLISGNYLMDQSLLSKDRWITYQITNTFRLKDITERVKEIRSKNKKLEKQKRDLER